MTSELTLLVLRLGFLAVLWIFVFSIIYALRSDLFGTRASEYQRRVEAQSRQQTFAGAADAPAPSPAPVPAAAPVAAAAGGVSAGSAGADAPTEATPRQSPAAPASDPSAPRQRAARIHVTSGPKRGTEVLLGAQPLSIGRSPESSLVIQDDYTSTRHARISGEAGRWVLEDLGSTNGTYVSGRRVTEPVVLTPGTPIRIGTTTFELR